MLLLLISFIAGVLTVLAPCVLPLLPVIVGGSLTTGSHRRAYAICVALGGSVIIFTLLLKVSTAFINVPQSFWEYFSGGILILIGIVMIFPRLWDSLGWVNRLNRSSNQLLASGYQLNTIPGDMLMGAALGPVFASCSPTYFVILATVLPASFGMGFLDLLAYAVGLSGFLLIIAIAGQKLVDRLGVTIEPGGWFRRAIGILFLVIGILIATGVEKKIEAWLLNNGFDVTAIEQKLLGAPTGSNVLSATSTKSSQEKSLIYPKAHELVTPDGYINTQGKPVTIGEFKGKKVVLLDIWTYSCINCQRTLPYIKSWYDKYKDDGLEIIGVHTPEFAFEKVQKNVEDAAARFGIKYPVVLDNQYQTWNAYGNQFWPRKYLIDIDGYVVYDHAGEGNYEQTERAIQAALKERADRLGIAMPDIPLSSNKSPDIEVASPETYFGAARNEYLGNGPQGRSGVQMFVLPANQSPNALYLGGTWYLQNEYAESRGATQVQFRYAAKSVYFVASADTPVKIKVTRDGGKSLGAARGADVDAEGYATIGQDRLYKLIEDTAYGVHTIEIQVESAGLKAYTFTFG